MTPELRVAMSAGSPDQATRARLCDILHYINSLYTVYTRLFIYDQHGEIVASTLGGQEDNATIGTLIEPHTLARVRALGSDQAYYVTPFEAHALYGDAPTWVYHAAIHSDRVPGQVVGGVGIVFHAAVELAQMLRGGSSDTPGMTAFFTDRSGRIVSGTDAARPVGSRLELDADLRQLASGQCLSRVVEHDGQYAVMGCSASSGYREFKVQDGYKDDVLAIVFDPIGPVRKKSASAVRVDTVIVPEAHGPDSVEYATFIADGVLYALPAAHVLEAVSAARLATTPAGANKACIGLLDVQSGAAQARPVWVFDLNRLLQKPDEGAPGGAQIIIVEHKGKRLGILVDELHDVKEFGARQILPSPFFSARGSALVQHLIRANQGELLIQGLGVDALFAMALEPA